MQNLNLPILNGFMPEDNVLIIGIGGGFDIFCGLPIFYEMNNKVNNIVLANYSFTKIKKLEKVTYQNDIVGLYKTIDNKHYMTEYAPEFNLKHHFSQKGLNNDIYLIERNGLEIVIKNIEKIIEDHKITKIIAIDGGFDSLMKGDEQGRGTFLEDSITMGAIKFVGLPSCLACIGFMTEKEDHVNEITVLRRINEIDSQFAFFGSCHLTKSQDAYEFYKEAYLACSKNHTSHISGKIINSIENPLTIVDEVLYSPLMSNYHFFHLLTVANDNLLIPNLFHTNTFGECLMKLNEMRMYVPLYEENHKYTLGW